MAPVSINDPQATASNGHTSAPSATRSAAVPIVDPTSARRPAEAVHVESPYLTYTDSHMFSKYTYHSANVVKQQGDRYTVTPIEKKLELKT